MTEPTTCTVPVEFLRGVIALCSQRGFSPENIEAWDKSDKWVADLWRKAEAALATPQPTQMQAVAVPLTKREVELLDGMIAVQLDHADRCDSVPNRTMADRQKGWDMERVALLKKIKQGGQHGTE